MYKVMVTGHRPQKLPIRSINAIKLALLERVQTLSDQQNDLVLVTGMALGVDTWFADITVKLGIPFYAVIPFHGQTLGWKHSDDLHYAKLITASKKLIVVAKSQSRQAHLNRNIVMVEMSDECIAV